MKKMMCYIQKKSIHIKVLITIALSGLILISGLIIVNNRFNALIGKKEVQKREVLVIRQKLKDSYEFKIAGNKMVFNLDRISQISNEFRYRVYLCTEDTKRIVSDFFINVLRCGISND